MNQSTRIPALRTTLLFAALVSGVLACAPREETVAPEADAGPIEAPQPTTAMDIEADVSAGGQIRARGDLVGAPDSGVSGTIEVSEEPGGARVVVLVKGVKSPGQHGLHLHEHGDCAMPHFESAGGHFNPTGAPHACPPAPGHAGDFGNIEIDAFGDGRLELPSDLLAVEDGPNSIVGRALVLHAGPDDCTTQPSGDSGDRLACGAIERVSD